MLGRMVSTRFAALEARLRGTGVWGPALLRTGAILHGPRVCVGDRSYADPYSSAGTGGLGSITFATRIADLQIKYGDRSLGRIGALIWIADRTGIGQPGAGDDTGEGGRQPDCARGRSTQRGEFFCSSLTDLVRQAT